MFDLITKCVFVTLWAFMVSAFNEGKWCHHPGANYHTKVNMSEGDCEGFFPPGTIATYYCDAAYNNIIISNGSIKNCVNGSWEATGHIFCGIESSTKHQLLLTNISNGSLHLNSSISINKDNKNGFVYENEDCKNLIYRNLSSIHINLKNENLFSIIVLQLTFELGNKNEFNVNNLHERFIATYYACTFPNVTDIGGCILFKSIKKMFKHVIIESKLTLLYHFQIWILKRPQYAFVTVKIKESKAAKPDYFLCNITLYAKLEAADCGSPNQNEGTLLISNETKANYFCPKNSQLVGNKSISCKNGLWTNKAPTCQDECKVLNRVQINNIIKTTVKTVAIILIIQWMLTGIAFLYFKYYKYQAKYLIKIKNDN